MKKTLYVLTCAALLLALVGCSSRHYSSSYKAILFVHSNKADSAFMRFSSISGRMVFKLKSSGNEVLSCTAKLEEGSATFYYDDNGTKTEFLSIRGGEQVSKEVANIGPGRVYVIVETDGKCSNGDFEFKLGK